MIAQRGVFEPFQEHTICGGHANKEDCNSTFAAPVGALVGRQRYIILSSNSLAVVPRARAVLTMFSKLTLRSRRSIRPIYVQCRSAFSANCSCDRPSTCRRARTAFPKATLGRVTPTDSCWLTTIVVPARRVPVESTADENLWFVPQLSQRQRDSVIDLVDKCFRRAQRGITGRKNGKG